MLLYLFTLTARWPLLKGHAGEFQEVEYLMVDPAPKDEGRAKALQEGGGLVYEKQGMILEREGEEEPPLPPEKQAAMAKASATESQQEADRLHGKAVVCGADHRLPAAEQAGHHRLQGLVPLPQCVRPCGRRA